jgi:hypothetical protein
MTKKLSTQSKIKLASMNGNSYVKASCQDSHEHASSMFYRENKTEYQDGRIYLTNYRVIYVENANQGINSGLALHLKHVRSIEAQSGFLASSPKIIVYLFPKQLAGLPSDKGTLKWVCDRCTYHNSSDRSICEMCDTPRTHLSRDIISLEKTSSTLSETRDHIENIYVKFSFRSGGHTPFFERFQLALKRKAWEVSPNNSLQPTTTCL